MQTALTPNRHNAPVCLSLPWACIYKTGAASPLQIRSGCAVCTLTAHKQETGIFHKQEEKTNMNKRILCILLAMIMVVGLLPAAAFAAEGSDAARFPYRYDARNGETAVKLSHPQVAPNAPIRIKPSMPIGMIPQRAERRPQRRHWQRGRFRLPRPVLLLVCHRLWRLDLHGPSLQRPGSDRPADGQRPRPQV